MKTTSKKFKFFSMLGIATATAMVLAACAPGSESNQTATPAPNEGKTGVIKVVASTNIWGSIVELIGGDLVEVVSIVDNPSQDPHSYEATARDQLAVSEAELIIANGGGYDPFMDQLVAARENREFIFLKVFEGEHIHGDDHDHHDDDDHHHDDHDHHHDDDDHHHDDDDHHHDDDDHHHDDDDHHHDDDDHHHDDDDHHHDDDDHHHDDDHKHGHGHSHSHEENEHVWFDLEHVRDFAAELASTLNELRPGEFEKISAGYDFFMSELENVEVRIEALRERALGLGALETAPLASLLLEAAGFELITPEDLLEAVEEEREIPATALAEAIELIESGQVSVLVVNRQLIDSQSQQLQRIAEQNGVPVVSLSELLVNPGDDYLDFMQNAIDQLQEAIY